MDGLLFYWVSWIFIVIAYFFINDGKRRDKLTFWLFIVIIIATYQLNLGVFEISWSGLIILLSSYLFIGKAKTLRLFHLLIASFIMMLAFSIFHLFALYDPVWLIFDEKLMLILLVTYLVLNLRKDFYGQVAILSSGVIHGDMFYSFFLRQYAIRHPIGDLYLLDCIAVSTACLFAIAMFKNLSKYLENYFKQTEREKDII